MPPLRSWPLSGWLLGPLLLTEEPPLRAVKPTSRPQLNGGYGADSGPSRGDPSRRAIRPFLPFGQPPLSPVAVTAIPIAAATF
jgi:hypothetical protein